MSYGLSPVWGTVNLGGDPIEYPALYAVRQDNTPLGGVTTGYLYRVGNEYHYSAATASSLSKLFDWEASLASQGKDPSWYLPTIAPDGTVIFIWRGNFVHERSGEAGDSQPRENPIVYPAGDYENPVEVDVEGDKPTAPLNNVGLDWHPSGYLVFAEYNRPVHAKGYIWKVTAPYTSPASWSRVHEEIVDDQDTTTGVIKHFHTANYDPFSDAWLASSGDVGQQTKVYLSVDGAETWTVEGQGDGEGGERPFRLLNFVSAQDYVWWATDNTVMNGLYRIARTNGVPDFGTMEMHRRLLDGQAPYCGSLVSDPAGILILSRVEVYPTHRTSLAVQFYDFTQERVITVCEIEPIATQGSAYGFRCEATPLYPNPDEERMVVGFDYYQNNLAVLDNTVENRIKTLTLEVARRPHQVQPMSGGMA